MNRERATRLHMSMSSVKINAKSLRFFLEKKARQRIVKSRPVFPNNESIFS
jgi:hypothetical protein